MSVCATQCACRSLCMRGATVRVTEMPPAASAKGMDTRKRHQCGLPRFAKIWRRTEGAAFLALPRVPAPRVDSGKCRRGEEPSARLSRNSCGVWRNYGRNAAIRDQHRTGEFGMSGRVIGMSYRLLIRAHAGAMSAST